MKHVIKFLLCILIVMMIISSSSATDSDPTCWPGFTITPQDQNCDGIVDGSLGEVVGASIVQVSDKYYLVCQVGCVIYYQLDTLENLRQPFNTIQEAADYFFSITGD